MREEDIDYKGGEIIYTEKEIVKGGEEECASLAASTPSAHYWTYIPSEQRCMVRKSKDGPISRAGAVSGNIQCGANFPGSKEVR